MMMSAIFLDKDGTLVEDVPYNVEPDRMRLAPGVSEGLWRLHTAGYPLIVISNQSGIARGNFPEAALGPMWDRLRYLCGTPFAGIYYCPHHPGGAVSRYALHCTCRKPAPGMLRRAAREHRIDLSRSWFIGDILDDVEAGRRAGCRTILLENGNETEWRMTPGRRPHFRAPDLASAARQIIAAAAAPREGLSP